MTGEPPVALAPSAHRRPGLVAMLYATRMLVGVLLTLPGVAVLGAVTAPYPRGQQELFDPGGVMLVESVRLARRVGPAIVYQTLGVGLLAGVLGLLPLAMLMAGLGREGRLSVAFLAGRAWAAVGTLVLVKGLGFLLQLVTVAGLALLGGRLLAAAKLAAPTEDLALAGMFVCLMGVMAAMGVVRDLAEVAAVHGGYRFYAASACALRCARRAPGRVVCAWAWRAALGAAGVAWAVWAAPSVHGVSSLGVAAAFGIHQASLGLAAFLRASWLAAAIRLLALPPRDLAASTAAPLAPAPFVDALEPPANPEADPSPPG